MFSRQLLRCKAQTQVTSFLRHSVGSGRSLVDVSWVCDQKRYSTSEASLENESKDEKGFKGHYMLAPFTAGWQSSDLHPLVIEKSEGVYVYDTNGAKYLDALAGLWCTALGDEVISYCHFPSGGNNQRLVDAAMKQLNTLPFTIPFGIVLQNHHWILQRKFLISLQPREWEKSFSLTVDRKLMIHRISTLTAGFNKMFYIHNGTPVSRRSFIW